jgi:hypothetical protein
MVFSDLHELVISHSVDSCEPPALFYAYLADDDYQCHTDQQTPATVAIPQCEEGSRAYSLPLKAHDAAIRAASSM